MNPHFSDSMDTSLLQLERELRSLSPAAPCSDLMGRISACVEPEAARCPVSQAAPRRSGGHSRFSPFPWRVVTPAAAAAMVVAVIGQNDRLSRAGVVASRSTTGQPANLPSPAVNAPAASSGMVVRGMVPAGFQREIQSMQDHGYSWNGGPSPLHQFSWRVLDHHVFQSPDNSGRIRLSIPREERAAVPVNFH